MKKAVILFSGGLDSSTILGYVKKNGYDCYPVSFNYGQRHSIEIEASKKVAKYFNIKNHKIITMPNDMFGSSALTDELVAVPDFAEERKSEIPITYVPARNTIFLSIALGYAESIGSHDIFVGVSYVDYSNYPDCRPEYIQAFEDLANLATKDGVDGKKITIHAPLLHLSKAETILMGNKHSVDYSLTVSCYNAD